MGRNLEFDEIGYWSELKLEIVEKYGAAYTTAFKNTRLKKYYIDGFSGAGVHVSKTTGTPIEGSPSRALRIRPPFDGYCFIDLDAQKTSFLESRYGHRDDVRIFTGDSNEVLLKQVLPEMRWKDYKRALCLLDPYGLHVDWQVIYQAGQSRTIDMFLNFPVMDMNRNAIWKNPHKAPHDGIERMNRYWGDDSWREAAYAEERDLFGPVTVKQGNDEVVEAFMNRLKRVAGFAYVAEPLPMRNKTNATVYYLFFAAQKDVANKIIADIFSKYRSL